jgi:hypothetical protein
VCTSVSFGRYSGGTGEPNSPYRIADANNMNEIGLHSEDWGSHFVLVNDVNLAEYTGTQFNVIGDFPTAFTGVFDGNSHSISNFNYDFLTTFEIGLFVHVNSPNAVIKNLTLIDPNVGQAAEGTGSLVGALSNGTIVKCAVLGGYIRGSYAGALVGRNSFGIISNCYATTTIIGESTVNYWKLGGLVGYNNGDISNCFASSVIVPTSIRVSEPFGGLVAHNTGTILNCYSTSHIDITEATAGLTGSNTGSVINSFWDIETSGQTESAGGVGKTTAEMKMESTFVGWDFVEVWDIGENQTYPYLRKHIAGDMNHDGIVDWRDFAILANNWLAGAE